MITPAFNITATERVLPKLALDFTTAVLDSRVTFTRTTDATHPATYVASNGYITSATDNQPRFDYNPTTLQCNGLLIEESRTNKVLYSNEFNNAAWNVKTAGAAVAPNAGISPDGTNNAYRLTFTAVDNYFGQTIATTSTTNYTFAIYIKSNNGATQYLRLRLYDGTTLTYKSITVTTAWQRLDITTSMNASATSNILIRSEAIPAAADVLLYAAQFEQGAFPTSYIPTTSAALTRNADVATMTGTNFSDWFNVNEGSFAVSSSNATPVSTETLWALYLDANNVIYTRRRFSTGPTFQFVQVAGGAASVAIQTETTDPYANGAIVNTCAGYKLNDFALSINGVNTGVDTSSSAIGAYTSFQIGTLNGTAFFNGWVREINYYPQKLTLAEINAFSK